MNSAPERIHATLLRAASIAVAAVLLMQIFSPAAALSLRPATFRELRQNSDVIVAASVQALRSEPSSLPHTGGVITRMTLEKIEALEGMFDGASLEVLLPGGEFDGLRVCVPGAPAFRAGDRVILFLTRFAGGDYSLTGHGMGVQRCSRDGWITPDIPVAGGVPARGEALSEFRLRFKGEGRAAAGTASRVATVVFAALLLLSVVLLRRKRLLRALAALAIAGGFLVAAFSGTTVAAQPTGAEFQLIGSNWNLRERLFGRVETGRVLWVRGRGTRLLNDDETFSAIGRMFDQWERIAESEIAFRQDGLTLESGTAVDSRNVISFTENPARPLFDKFTLAVTFLFTRTGETIVRDADIVFNDRDIAWTLNNGPASIESVGLHEIGHLLGLDHTGDPNTVMFPISQGLRELAPGEKFGAEALYPQIFAAPEAVVFASPPHGAAPLNVSFDSSASNLIDAETAEFSWDFGDGTPGSAEPNPQHTYTAPGTYVATLTVATPGAGSSSAGVAIVVTAKSAPLDIQVFQYQAALYQSQRLSRDPDRLDFSCGPVDLAAGDAFIYSVGEVEIGEGDQTGTLRPILLDTRGAFRGASNLGGALSARIDSKSRHLKLSLRNARLGQMLDPRAPDNIMHAGAGTLQVRVLIYHADSSTTSLTAEVKVFFTIRAGRIPNGVIEKSIKARKL